mgnify:CR=1 FL=1
MIYAVAPVISLPTFVYVPPEVVNLYSLYPFAPDELFHEMDRLLDVGVLTARPVGVAGALPSAVNAVLDALAERGVSHLDLPMSPYRVWAASSTRSSASCSS